MSEQAKYNEIRLSAAFFDEKGELISSEVMTFMSDEIEATQKRILRTLLRGDSIVLQSGFTTTINLSLSTTLGQEKQILVRKTDNADPSLRQYKLSIVLDGDKVAECSKKDFLTVFTSL